MYSKLILFSLTIVALVTLGSCGDLTEKNVIEREMDGTQFSVNCELDMNRFAKILNENIAPQIRCLGENLNLFIKVVKSEKPGYLSRAQLEKYLANHRPDVKPEVITGLKSIFDIGHLITGEDSGFISQSTIDKVIKFGLIFNQEAALNFGPIFQNESPVTYALHQNHRERVSSATKSILQSLRSVFNPNRNGETHSLNIISLLESFTNESNRDVIDKAKKILFAKKILVGGENEIMTHHELDKLILNFDRLLLIGLDVVRYKFIILKQESILQLLKKDVGDFYDIITQGPLNDRDDEVILSVDDAVEATELFIENEDLQIQKFRNLFGEVKKIMMGGNDEVIKGVELKTIFNEAKKILQTGTVFHRIYEKFKAQLDNPSPVEETIDFDEFRHTYPEYQEELQFFERIAKKYRFMKGEFLAPYYTRGSKRNPDAFFEIYLLEYAIKKVFMTYGSPSPNAGAVGGFSIDKDQMRKVLQKFQNELIELDLIIPGMGNKTADNISLLGTLFQYQSDDNKVMDVNELTEFGESLISSMNIAGDIHDYLKEQNCTLDAFGRVDPDCFRNNFWKGFCTYYRSYFPLLAADFKFPAKCENIEANENYTSFLMTSVQAARTCNNYTDGNKEEIFFSKGDLMSIILVIMHAETTVLRWDTNKNNIMDPSEVNNAYDIYSPALDGFLENKSSIIKKLKKQIYQYLIKYEKIPDDKNFGSIWSFVKFLLSFNKEAPASRKTIVSVLKVIGDETEKLEPSEFDCNLLRDPDNIPRSANNPNSLFSSKLARKLPSTVSSSDLDESQLQQSLGETINFLNSFSSKEKEFLKLEISSVVDDISSGDITKLKHLKDSNLKDVLKVVLKNKGQMAAIREFFTEGSDLQKASLAVSMILLSE